MAAEEKVEVEAVMEAEEVVMAAVVEKVAVEVVMRVKEEVLNRAFENHV